MESTNDKTFFAKHCKGFPYTPPIIKRVPRIIAIGDIHGDLKLAKDCLKVAKCINNNDEWIGGNTYVVQVGDQIDSCRPLSKVTKCNQPGVTINDEPSDIKILEFFTKVDKKAREQGGMVVNLLGNHELMNVMGNMDYVSYENLVIFDPKTHDVFKGEDRRKQQFKPGSKWANYLGCTRLSSVIIGDFIFVHAGFVPNFIKNSNIKSKGDIVKINHLVRKWLLNKLQDDLQDTDYVNSIINSNPTSMFWDRILGTLPGDISMDSPKCQEYLQYALNIFGVKSMIIGHTPQFHQQHSGINWTCNREDQPHGLYRVDFGGSHAFHFFDRDFTENMPKDIDISSDHVDSDVMNFRKPQVLEIVYEKPGDLNDVPTVNILI